MAKPRQRQRRQEERPLHRKYCQFCKENVEFIDYKDTQLLRKFMTDRGKIKPPYTVPVVSNRGSRNRG